MVIFDMNFGCWKHWNAKFSELHAVCFIRIQCSKYRQWFGQNLIAKSPQKKLGCVPLIPLYYNK